MSRYLWLINLLLFIACQRDTVPETKIPATDIIVDVAYGKDPKQKMDVYLPARRSIDSTKILVLIHGGGWIDLDKSDFTPFVAQLQQKLPGYAIFNVNYRLAENAKNLFPTQENDIKTAIEFIDSKRSEYTISDKIVFLGASAGGHLALLQGYKYNTPLKPRAIISFFGPSDLTALYKSNPLAGMVLTQVTGVTPSDNSTIYVQSSPATFVNAQSPPTILLHGGADPVVSPKQSELLKNLLNNAGVPNQYVFYPKEKHGWSGTNLTDSFEKIARFLEKYVEQPEIAK
jgi:acetyl esterase/lipase